MINHVKGTRACPICSGCGFKKFSVIKKDNSNILIECLKCKKRMEI
jgi:hypothetical protein